MIGRRSHDDAQAFEEACGGRAPRDSHIAELLRIADELCADAAAVQPSPEFRSTLRTQLMTEATTVLVARPATARPTAATALAGRARRRPTRRRITSLVAAVVASAATLGIVASSASAVPGELLYPVKRGTETVELQLHRSDASRGSFQLSQASERLDEARQLSADGRSIDLITDTLDDFAAAAADGSNHLFSDFAENGSQKSIREVNAFATASSIDLSDLSAELPTSAATSFTAATAAVTDLASKASTLCSTCKPADVRPLAGSVDSVTKPAPSSPSKPATTPRSPAAPAPQAPQATTPQQPAPAPAATPARPTSTTAAPVVPLPTPSITVPTEPLTDLLDPLVDGLLGEGEQPGLVPDLLGGVAVGEPTPEP